MGGEAGEEEAGAIKKPRRFSGKKQVLYFVLPVLLLLGGGGAGYVLLFSGGGLAGYEGDPAAEEEPEDVAFYDMPEMLVNLEGGDRTTHYLKLRIALEVQDKAMLPTLEAVLPRIVDTFQVYLRELRLDDLKGSAGMVRLKEELLLRVNTASQKLKINDVLFKEMLVQ